MRISQMDIQVTVQSLTTTRDSAGGVVKTWANLLEGVWVQRRQTGGSESAAAQREAATQAVEFWGHCADWIDITTRHRLLLGSQIYDIVRVDLNRSKGSALIACTEGLQ